jgi:type I restriction enzyme, R subunit
MSSHHPDAEDALEAATVARFADLGWKTAYAYSETFPGSLLGRETAGEVVLRARLRPALERLNPSFPREAIEQAVEELARDLSALSMAHRRTARSTGSCAAVSRSASGTTTVRSRKRCGR